MVESQAGPIRRRMDVGVLGATGMVGQQFVLSEEKSALRCPPVGATQSE